MSLCTLPDDLEQKINRYLEAQAVAPSLSTLVQLALRQYLDAHALSQRGFTPSLGHLKITPAKKGSGESEGRLKFD